MAVTGIILLNAGLIDLILFLCCSQISSIELLNKKSLYAARVSGLVVEDMEGSAVLKTP